MAKIIFLHGASSSGKTTLARRLQARIEAPFWHISIDHLRDAAGLPSASFNAGDFSWSEARPAFFAGFHGALKAYAEAANNLILEHILDTSGWLEDLRAVARADRPPGNAAQDFTTIHV